MRTLKEEEVHGTQYDDLEDARNRIGEFLEQVYNRQRLQPALCYLRRKNLSRPTKLKRVTAPMGAWKPNAGLPPLPQALEIISGFPRSRGGAAASIN
jgi:hypothetical protein